MSKGKQGDLEVINLDLKTPPSVPSLVGQGRPSCHSPETIKKSLFMPLLESRRHEMMKALKVSSFQVISLPFYVVKVIDPVNNVVGKV